MFLFRRKDSNPAEINVDRFVQYVNRVRSLDRQREAEIKALEKRQESHIREHLSMQKLYEHKMADKDKLVNKLRDDCATLQFEKEKMNDYNADLKKRYRFLVV